MDDLELNNLVEKFYNDTFVMDQNACSSPHIVFWFGKKNEVVINKFWLTLSKLAKNKFNLENSLNNIGNIENLTHGSSYIQASRRK